MIHEKNNIRKTWAPHGVEGWYLGPALEHYRCYRVYAAKTGGERVSDTVQFFPHVIPMPGTTAKERAIEVAVELIDAITNFKHVEPLKQMSNTQMEALHKLAEIFNVSTGVTQKTSKLRNSEHIKQGSGISRVKTVQVTHMNSPKSQTPQEITTTKYPRVMAPMIDKVHVIPEETNSPQRMSEQIPYMKDNTPHIVEENAWGKA